MKATLTLRLPPELFTTLSIISYNVFFALSIQLAIDPVQSMSKPKSRISSPFPLPFYLIDFLSF